MIDYHRDKNCTELLSSSPPLLKNKREAFSFPDIVHKFVDIVQSNSEKKTDKSKEKVKMILKGISLDNSLLSWAHQVRTQSKLIYASKI